MLNDVQFERERLTNSEVNLFLCEKYKECKIHIGNFGYIIVPHDKNKDIIKFYTERQYLDNEVGNYDLLKKSGIITPKKGSQGEVVMCGDSFFYLHLGNIRKKSDRFRQVVDIGGKRIGILLSKLHSSTFLDGKAFLHGNLHQSNFFLGENNTLGLFDLVGMIFAEIEYDLSILYLNSGYDDDFLNLILENYSYAKDVDMMRVYKYTLIKIIENIKYSVSLCENTREQLKLDLLLIRQKINAK